MLPPARKYRDCHGIAQYGAWLNATFEFRKNPSEAPGGHETSKTSTTMSKHKKRHQRARRASDAPGNQQDLAGKKKSEWNGANKKPRICLVIVTVTEYNNVTVTKLWEKLCYNRIKGRNLVDLLPAGAGPLPNASAISGHGT
jgi:hypothetical protein